MKRRKRGRRRVIGPEEVLVEVFVGWISTGATSIPCMSSGEEAKREIDAVVSDPDCPLDA